MREIKFRGKRVDNGEWVSGYIIDFPQTKETLIGKFYAKDDNFTVIPETVGQYTGLKDKNGREIYEGDIVSTDLSRPYNVVQFKNGCFVFQCHDSGQDYYDTMTHLDDIQIILPWFEVIGNIHETPELLEVD
ncbi:MAG: YopX family protein [Syntrophomonas sp.]|nr:YopX family protein [Syntrophomonas sp.]